MEVPLSHFTERETEVCGYSTTYPPKTSEVLGLGKHRNKKEGTGHVILGKLLSLSVLSFSI